MRVARSPSKKAAGLALRAFSSALRAGAERSGDAGSSLPGMSSRTTGKPAEAASAAIPLPITPAPTTPTFVIRIRSPLGGPQDMEGAGRGTSRAVDESTVRHAGVAD